VPDAADRADWVSAAERAADAAGVVLRPYFRTGLDTALKADLSPVTRADREAEQAMRTVLAQAHPDHQVLGEEGGLHGAASRYRWALDPIDGTRAFITGRPVFGTLVALLDDGAPVVGVIDQPVTGERWVGCMGQPTRFTGGFGRIGTRRGRMLGDCELSCTSPAMFDEDEARRWHGLGTHVRRVSYGGDCYAYGLLALGQIDIVAEAGLKLWDWAALLPVVAGAGGCMTDWNGAALTPGGDGRVLALGDPALLGQVVDALRPGLNKECAT
jgi:histidinol phosphatase-like enzyme (inositol monophosphatase family)